MLGSKTQFDQLTGDVLDTIGEYLDLQHVMSDRSGQENSSNHGKLL